MNPGRFLQEGVGKQGCESISGGGHSVPELPLQSVQMLLPYPPPVMFLVPTSDGTYFQKLRSRPRGDSQGVREASEELRCFRNLQMLSGRRQTPVFSGATDSNEFNNILRLPFSLIFLLYWTSATFFFLLLVLPSPPEK